jgi:hypothetical protein
MLRNLITIEKEDSENKNEISNEIEELSMDDSMDDDIPDNLIKLPDHSSNNPNLSINTYTRNLKNESIGDDNSVLVIILKCETRKCDKNIENLKLLFSDQYFIVEVCEIPNQLDDDMKKILNYIDNGPYLLNEEGIYEPQNWWKELPTIIIKDSSISHLTPENNIHGIKHKIKTALEKANNADLFYLCKWNDSCEKHRDVENYPDKTLKWSVKPTATQAIMYTKKTRKYIIEQLENSDITLGELLNSHIDKCKLSAAVFTPNLIDYDINLAVSNSDYNKMNECDPAVNTQTVTNNNTYLLIIVLIILIIIAAWFIINPPVRYVT